MVSSLLKWRPVTFWASLWVSLALVLACGLWTPAHASRVKIEKNEWAGPPDLLLQGGRKLAFLRTFGADRDVGGKRGFWKKMLDVVAGEPDRHQVIRPYGIAIDSRGRAIVTDPGAMGIHIFDFAEHKYKFIVRNDKDENSMRSPQCVAVDALDNF